MNVALLVLLQSAVLTNCLSQLRGGAHAELEKKAMSRTCGCVLNGQNCFTEKKTPRLQYSDRNLKGCRVPQVNQYGNKVDDKIKYKLDYSSMRQLSEVNHTQAHRTSTGLPWVLNNEKNPQLPQETQEHLHVRKNIPNQRTIYLTYDDGILCEDRDCKKQWDFLDLADYYGVKITQFVLANRFRQKMPEEETTNPCKTVHYSEGARKVVKEYVKRGHTIGSHTNTHVNVAREAFDFASKNIKAAEGILRNETGLERIKHFRPPNLELTDKMASFLVNDMHYEVWGSINGGNSDWEDWELKSDDKEKYALQAADFVKEYLGRPNVDSAVLCLHDRPFHQKYFGEMLTQMCKVCPECEFKGVDGDAAH